MMDDGGTDDAAAASCGSSRWPGSPARRRGSTSPTSATPSSPPPAHLRPDPQANRALWTGPLGPVLLQRPGRGRPRLVRHPGARLDWGANGPFAGLAGIAYSTEPRSGLAIAGDKPFPAPLGNLSWVIRGRGRQLRRRLGVRDRHRARVQRHHADHGPQPPRRRRHDRPGRVAVGVGLDNDGRAAVAGVLELAGRGRADRQLGRRTSPIRRWPTTRRCTSYLLTFTYSYAPTPPAIWRDGAELVILGRAAPVGPVLVRRPRAVLRALQRLRRRLPDQLDQPRRPRAVAQVGGQLRRLRAAPGLLGRLRIQLPSDAAHARRRPAAAR